MSTLLSLSSVACVRGGRLLFEGLDLELGPGEALHVTGPNGSGFRFACYRLASPAGRGWLGSWRRTRPCGCLTSH